MRNNLDRIHEDEKIEKSLGQETPNSENDSPCQRTMPERQSPARRRGQLSSSLPPGFVDKNEAGVAHKPTHPLRRRLPCPTATWTVSESRGGSLFLSFFLG